VGWFFLHGRRGGGARGLGGGVFFLLVGVLGGWWIGPMPSFELMHSVPFSLFSRYFM